MQHFQADFEYLGKINTKNKISIFFLMFSFALGPSKFWLSKFALSFFGQSVLQISETVQFINQSEWKPFKKSDKSGICFHRGGKRWELDILALKELIKSWFQCILKKWLSFFQTKFYAWFFRVLYKRTCHITWQNVNYCVAFMVL